MDVMEAAERLAKHEEAQETPPPEPVKEGAEVEVKPEDKVSEETAEGQETPTGDAEKQEEPKYVPEKRFKEVYGKMKTLERKVQALSAQPVQVVQQPPAQLQPNPNEFQKPKPVLAQFKDYDEYVDALTDWKIEKKDWDARIRNYQVEQQRTQQAQATFYEGKMNEGVGKYEGFYETADDLGQSCTPVMKEALFRSPMFSELVMVLGDNLDEARRIAGLDPFEQIAEIKAVEKEIKAELANLKNKETRKEPAKVEKPGEGIPQGISPSLQKLKATGLEKAKTGDMRDLAKFFHERGI